MAKSKKLRKEKYIKQKTVNGNLYLQVSFSYEDQIGIKRTYNKNFNVKDYSSPASAMNAAVAHRDEIRSILLHGERIASPVDRKHSVDEVFELIQEVFPRTLKTVKRRRSYYNMAIKPLVGYKPIEDITPLDIQRTLNESITIRSQDYLKRIASTWRYLIKTAAFMGFITSDPMLQVVVPISQVPGKPMDVDTDRETVDRVIQALRTRTQHNSHYRFDTELLVYLIELIYYTGIRPAEALGLSKSDVNLTEKYLYIHSAQGSTVNSMNATKSTKTVQSIRREPIVPDLAVILDKLMKIQPASKLFQKWDGTIWKIDAVCTKIRYVCVNEGITFNLYRLRHKFSTDLVTAKVDPRTIMELMGHNNIQQTLEYARSNDDLKEEALNIRKYS